MRIHRFFVDQQLSIKPKFSIEDTELVHQWRNVLRYQVGQEVILYDNTGYEYKATVTLLSARRTEVDVHSSRKAAYSVPLPLFLFASLAKRDSFEWMLEKATEIGVTGFCPVVSEHSEKKEVNIERARILIKEACEQSERPIMPDIFEPVSLAAALQNLTGGASGAGSSAVTIVLDPTGEPLSKKIDEYKQAGMAGKRINIFVGPEGGFSPRELELFHAHNVPVVSVGKQILRAETAAVAIATLFLLP
jgi:16S rRNA (uracil1498-N3)-methyltransferase